MTQTTPTAAPGVSTPRQLTPFEVQEAWVSGEPVCKISDVTALLASAAGGEPRAWLTEHDSGDMVWTDKAEAEAYADDAGPLPLYTAPPPPVGELQGVTDAEVLDVSHFIYGKSNIQNLPTLRRALEYFVASRPVAPVAAVDADPLQGAANWLVQAHPGLEVPILAGKLSIGYNRAKRLYDAATPPEGGIGEPS